MNLFDRLHQKLELFRLEQRYTRRRNRRSTFISEAQYVDGEYIYSASPTYSAKCCATSSDEEVSEQSIAKEAKEEKAKKRVSRMSMSMGPMGMDWKTSGKSTTAEKRQSRVVVREVRA